ncbi:hypothetical protein X975_26137, partial [Stegodyphus mimosarum]
MHIILISILVARRSGASRTHFICIMIFISSTLYPGWSECSLLVFEFLNSFVVRFDLPLKSSIFNLGQFLIKFQAPDSVQLFQIQRAFPPDTNTIHNKTTPQVNFAFVWIKFASVSSSAT